MGGIDVADNCKSSIPPIGEECVRSTGWKLGYSRYARYVYCMIVLIDFRPLPTLSDSRSLPEPRYEFLKLRLVLLPRCSHSEQFCLDIIEITEEEEEGKEKKEEENNVDLTSRHFKIHLYLFERKEKGRGWFENYRGKNCKGNVVSKKNCIPICCNFVSKRRDRGGKKFTDGKSIIYDRANIKYSSRCRMYELIEFS